MSTYMQDLKKTNPEAYEKRVLAGPPGVPRRNMIKALQMHSWLNTPEDNARLEAAKWCQRHGC